MCETFFAHDSHRSECVWKKLGKDGFAVKAPWPIADEEDKLLSRQGDFLRKSLRQFRAQAGKAKKGWKTASIVVSNVYPDWKVDTLKWMRQQYTNGSFSDSFMKDLKVWSGENVKDKKQMKFTMQFASFRKREAEDFGEVAMDIQLPFDQKSTLEGSLSYFKSQLNVPELDISLSDECSGLPDRVKELVEPGTPYLWMR